MGSCGRAHLVTTQELGLVAFSTAASGLLGAVVGAFAATSQLKEQVAKVLQRIIRLEQRIGVTEDGTLTGNGLMADVHTIRAKEIVR